MSNPNALPEISVQDLSQKLSTGDSFILMDVREPHELQYAKLPDEVCGYTHTVTFVPMSKLAQELLDGLPETVQDKETEIVVMCHTGRRSGQVTAWLRQNGWTNVHNLTGGIDAYARLIDPSVGLY